MSTTIETPGAPDEPPGGNAPIVPPPARFAWSLAGLGIAGIAYLVAAISPWLMDLAAPPPKPLDEVAADFVVRVKERVKAKLQGQKLVPQAPLPQPPAWPSWIPAGIIALGVLGAAGGVAGFVRREDLRTSGAAVAVGTSAIFVQYAVLIVMVVIGLIAFYLALRLLLLA